VKSLNAETLAKTDTRIPKEFQSKFESLQIETLYSEDRMLL